MINALKPILIIVLAFSTIFNSSVSNNEKENFKQVINSIIEEQKENFEFYSPKEVKYSYFDFNDDGIKELMWITAVGGFNLLDIPIYIIYSDGTYVRIDNSFYMTKSLEDLQYIKKYRNDNGECIYLIKTDVFSTGEQRICYRFYDADFEFISGYKQVNSLSERYYFIDFINDEFIENELTCENFDKNLNQFINSMTFIEEVPIKSIDAFSIDDIETFISAL
jgi:hypothetical protein